MRPHEDWLVHRTPSPTTLTTLADGSLSLSNQLISRRFLTAPNWATVSFRSEMLPAGGKREFLRGVAPEARLRISCPDPVLSPRRELLPYAPAALEGVTDPNVTGSSKGSAGMAVGGLRGQRRYAMLDLSLWNLTAGSEDWRYVAHSTESIVARWRWTPGQRHSVVAPWPPHGLALRVAFAPPAECHCYCGVRVEIVYEMYDGIPTLSKRVELKHQNSRFDSKRRAAAPADFWAPASVLTSTVSSTMALSKAAMAAGATPLIETVVTEELHVTEDGKARLHAETDYMPRKTFWARAKMASSDAGGGSYAGFRMNYPTWWLDPDYEDDTHDQSLHADLGALALLLQLQYPLGPWQPLPVGEDVKFYTAFLTLFDSDDEERNSLCRRRVIRTLFPQVTESPLYFYLTNASSAGVRHVADQAAEVGFEAIILSFGSGFDPSSSDPEYIARIRADTLYCRSKGILIGGYTLMQNPPRMVPGDYCKSPDSDSYGVHIADFSTDNHAKYRERIFNFLEQTTMEILETDGPYEGAACAVTNSSGFKHVNNSQFVQYRATVDFYRELKQRFNTFNTVPDPYWSAGGTNKEPMGYTDGWTRQVPTTPAGNDEEIELGRMYLFDGTKHKPVTMGWIGFELGSRITSPMQHRLRTLEDVVASYLGQGNLPALRGPYLYDDDSPEVKLMWTLWVAHFKKYRSILLSDPVHIMRPTGRSLEVILHVNASARGILEVCAFANMFNPTGQAISMTLELSLYYAGVEAGDAVRLEWGGSLVDPAAWPYPSASTETVLSDYTVRIDLSAEPRSFLWVAFRRQP